MCVFIDTCHTGKLFYTLWTQIDLKAMALNLQDIKYVDDRTLSLLCGYLRKMAENTDALDFQPPKLIINICTLFYFNKEYFALIVNGGKFHDTYNPYKRECISLSDDKLSVFVIDECQDTIYRNFTAYSLQLGDAIFE